MDFNNRHPLGAITNSESLSMLEALIPYVDYPLKLPLALLIKYYEINRIMQVFQSLDNLSRFGLHNTNTDPMDILCGMSGISPDILRMAFDMMGNGNSNNPMNLMSMLGGNNNFDPQTLFNMSSSFTKNKNHTSDPDNDSFEQNIKSIFSDYDMMQASSYNEEYEKGVQNDISKPCFHERISGITPCEETDY